MSRNLDSSIMNFCSVFHYLTANVPELKEAICLPNGLEKNEANVDCNKQSCEQDDDPSCDVSAFHQIHEIRLADDETEQHQDKEFVCDLLSAYRWLLKRITNAHDRD